MFAALLGRRAGGLATRVVGSISVMVVVVVAAAAAVMVVVVVAPRRDIVCVLAMRLR